MDAHIHWLERVAVRISRLLVIHDQSFRLDGGVIAAETLLTRHHCDHDAFALLHTGTAKDAARFKTALQGTLAVVISTLTLATPGDRQTTYDTI